MCSLMMISSMLSKHVGAVKSVLKKLFKNKLHTISAFVGFVIIIKLRLVCDLTIDISSEEGRNVPKHVVIIDKWKNIDGCNR